MYTSTKLFQLLSSLFCVLYITVYEKYPRKAYIRHKKRKYPFEFFFDILRIYSHKPERIFKILYTILVSNSYIQNALISYYINPYHVISMSNMSYTDLEQFYNAKLSGFLV